MQYVKQYKLILMVAVIIFAAAVIIVTLTQNQEGTDTIVQDEGSDEAGAVAHLNSIEQTLTISLPAIHEFNATMAGETFTRQMAETGIQLHLEFDLNRFTQDDDPIPDILSHLAAGIGADV